MYRVLIVDDEQNIRDGLSKVINWEAHGFAVCGEASDGEEGLAEIEKHSPDLAVVDIKMPGMNGIEMIRELKRRQSACRAIILSGYSDFAFAQQALEYGAAYYLLKPIDRNDLSDKINAIREELDRDREEREFLNKSLKLSRDGILESLISGDGDMELLSAANGRFGFDFPWSSYQIVLITVEGREDGNEARQPPVREALEGYVSANGLGLVFEAGAGFALLVRDRRTAALPQYAADLKKAIRDACGLEAGIAEGSVVMDFFDIYSSYLQAHKLIRKRFFIGADTVLSEGKARALPAGKCRSDAGFDSEKMILRLHSAVDVNETAGIGKALDDVRAAMTEKEYPPITVKTIYAYLYVGVVNKFLIQNETLRGLVDLNDRDLQSILACEDIWQLQETMKKLLSALTFALDRVRPANAIERILDYIARNFSEDLKLEALAQTFHYNSVYLGKLFKKHTGQHFNAYLDMVRMEEAKKLLEEGCLVYQAAEKIGFDNIRYFHTKFKKYTGVSPSEFKKHIE